MRTQVTKWQNEVSVMETDQDGDDNHSGQKTRIVRAITNPFKCYKSDFVNNTEPVKVYF